MKKRKRLSKVAEAGGIVVKFDTETPHFLIIRAKKNPIHWIFPKGHIEDGESAKDAAIREVREEAGIEATLIDLAGAIEFDYAGETIEVEFYLLKYSRTLGGGEQRESRWCTYEEALDLLSFDDAKDLLRSSLKILEKHSALE